LFHSNEEAVAPPTGGVTIAIDGPSGAGKGTVGRGVASTLGYQYIDTGAMYRAVAFVADRRGVSFDDELGLGEIARALPIHFAPGDPPKVIIDGEDASSAIRSEKCGVGASKVSQVQSVRQGLVVRQRSMGELGGVVMDGRDIGTVVFPDAEVKVFLTASVECRISRRIQQLENRGGHIDAEKVGRELRERDERDSTRANSPLRPAADAVVVDTSDLSIDEVTSQIVALARAALARV